jgi:predicted O-methyltransferase YrrM
MKHFTKTVEDMYPVLEPHLHPMDRGAFGDEFLRTKNSYEWLASIAWELQPKRILEIGVRFGYGAISMLWGTAKGKPPAKTSYWGLDNEQAEAGSNDFARSAILPFCEGWPVLMKKLIENLPSYDLIYVDGYHTPEAVLEDLALAGNLRMPGGVILVDDVTFIPSLMQPVLDWARAREFETEWLPTYRGLLVLSAP